MTPFGQLPFFIEFKQGGLFDSLVGDCPPYFTSPNAPQKRDVIGTISLSVLAGHKRYAHMTVRCDPVNPPLLGMTRTASEDAVRRGLNKIEEEAGETSVVPFHVDAPGEGVNHDRPSKQPLYYRFHPLGDSA